MGGGLCICLALCICITVCCCCYHKKKTQRHTATTATAATPMSSVQPTVAINQLRMQQTGQQDSDNPPEYNPDYTSYPETYTQPSPYPPVASGTLPPTYPQAGSTVPQTLLPTPLWVVGPSLHPTLHQEIPSLQDTLLSPLMCLLPIQRHLPSTHSWMTQNYVYMTRLLLADTTLEPQLGKGSCATFKTTIGTPQGDS